MNIGSILLLLRQNNLPFGDQTKACQEIEAGFKYAIDALCPDCAKGLIPSHHGDHVLEEIQGNVSWSRTCQAWPFRKLINL